MNIITGENLSKSYGEKKLFENIEFIINDEDKIGLIGINGTGKSTLLKIIAGFETPDTGNIKKPNGVTIEYLPQNPYFDDESTVLEQVFKGDSPTMILIREYEFTLELLSQNPNDKDNQSKIIELSNKMDELEAWEMESQVKTVLTKLGIKNYNDSINTLSGGQRKRVALCSALLSPSDLLILDEPTNHMDNDTIDWLENYLNNRKKALLMITHDRYFLDRVVNKTFELDKGTLYSYTCNYSKYIEKKLEIKENQKALEQKMQRLYKKELEWMRKGAKARTTKQNARINRFEELEKDLDKIEVDGSLDISIPHKRLGKKIIEINSLLKSFGENLIIKDFSCIFQRSDRIGIVGKNGAGKSTLLNLITGKEKAYEGRIDKGSTVKIGYFSQESEDMDVNMRAIEYVKESAEYVTGENNIKISASQMMERFLFNSNMQWTYIRNLSGGERRRLYLLKILMESPNVLILDEPTNDLDIDTLKVLENFIDDFTGTVVTVSHDRYFLDRICNKILYLDGTGTIYEYTGNYSDFLSKKSIIKEENTEVFSNKEAYKKSKEKQKKVKLTYKEKIEFENVDSEIIALEEELNKIEELLHKYSTDYDKLQDIMEKKEKIEDELLFKLERQEYFENIQNNQLKN